LAISGSEAFMMARASFDFPPDSVGTDLPMTAGKRHEPRPSNHACHGGENRIFVSNLKKPV
jgi:hypothetical protein